MTVGNLCFTLSQRSYPAAVGRRIVPDMSISQQRFDVLRPSFNSAFRRFKMIAAVGIKLHLHFAGNSCAGTDFFHVLNDMTGSAGVCHKRYHGLAREVIPVQECLDRRSHGVPPCGRTYGDHIICSNIHIDWL